MHPLLWFSAGTITQQQQGSTGWVSSGKVGRPREQHSSQAVEAWDPEVNHMQHASMPSCSTHQNSYRVPCSTGAKPSKHRAYMAVRMFNAKRGRLSCHVCSGKGSRPEQVLYELADKEELIKVYAVEACGHSKQGGVEVCEAISIHPSKKRWDLTVLAPHGLLVEVMGEGHSSRLVTKPNNTDDSTSTRQRRDYAYADAAVKRGWSVLWLWVEEGDPSFRRTRRKWAAKLREALKHVAAEGKPELFNS
jgi:hypothetical protein